MRRNCIAYMAKGLGREVTGVLPGSKTNTGQPVIDGRYRNSESKPKHGKLRKRYSSENLFPKRNQNSYGDDDMMAQFLLPLTRRDFYTRKDTARKNLMGYLYTRQPALHRSYSFVAGEKPANEPGLPKISQLSRERSTCEINRSKGKVVEMIHNDISLGQVRDFLRSESHRSSRRYSVDRKATPLNSHSDGSHKVQLPELINGRHNDAHSDGTESLDSLTFSQKGDKRLKVFESNSSGTEMKVYPSRYRPITPSLLRRLDSLKLPSRLRTKEWVKLLPTDTRAYIGESRINANCVPDHAADTNEYV